MTPNIEIIALIYKSIKYLDFIMAQLTAQLNSVPGWDIKLRIVANDATPSVLNHLANSGFPYSEYKDRLPSDYYLNRVYRAWNWAGASSQCDHICFVNSDMAFSPNWLTNLLKHHDGTNIPCSRLVESGRLESYNPTTINKNFGLHPGDFREKEWLDYANSISEDKIVYGGTYMPVVFEKNRFVESGMFPEGNLLYVGDKLVAGTSGHSNFSGDNYFFQEVLEKKLGMKQVTAYDSLVYHTQSGEMLE